MTLNQCSHQSRVRVAHLEGDSPDLHRLREVGVFEDAICDVVTGGDPVILSLYGGRFALSAALARHVHIQLIHG
ncbi:MAG: FeoA family protein [Candidatus Xenobia bacterium]